MTDVGAARAKLAEGKIPHVQHSLENGVLVHAQMKQGLFVGPPRAAESWINTPCDCDSAGRMRAWIHFARREEVNAALEAVLAIEPRIVEGTGVHETRHKAIGYNQCLADARSTVLNALGVGEE